MNISTPRYGKILLGRQGENLATKVIIQINQIKTGDGYPLLVHQRAKDTEPYPVAVTEDGDAIEWIVTSADTEHDGYGRAEVRWMGANGEIAKSVTYQTHTEKSMTEPGEPPDVWEGYLGQVAENAHIAQVAAEGAEQAASTVAESAQAAANAANKAVESAQSAAADKKATETLKASAEKAAEKAAEQATAAEKSAKEATAVSTEALEKVDELAETVSQNKAAAEKFVSDEATARKAEDGKLDTKIGSLANTVATNKATADNAIAAETTARKKADDVLEQSIDDLKQEIGSLANIMNFRGAVDSTATIADPMEGDVVVVTGTGKEYVYSNGKWVELGDTSAERKDITALQGRMDTAEGNIKTLKASVDDLTVSDIEALELLTECGVITPAGTTDGKLYTLNGKIATI